jgi:hypothetical protein
MGDSIPVEHASVVNTVRCVSGPSPKRRADNRTYHVRAKVIGNALTPGNFRADSRLLVKDATPPLYRYVCNEFPTRWHLPSRHGPAVTDRGCDNRTAR